MVNWKQNKMTTKYWASGRTYMLYRTSWWSGTSPHYGHMTRINGETLWIGRLSLTTGRTCLESKGFMPVKIPRASNSHNSQDSKIKQQEHQFIQLVVVELNSRYLSDFHHSDILILRFTLLPPGSEVLNQWRCVVTFFFFNCPFGRVLWASSE